MRRFAQAQTAFASGWMTVRGVRRRRGVGRGFVLSDHADWSSLVRTIVDAVEEQVRAEHGRSPLRSEGVGEQQWVLVDFGDVVVHVFADEVRAYYEIERLYRDVPRLEWQATAPDPA
jgi:ribosome silencing factor RsfS/YbeB/iojap